MAYYQLAKSETFSKNWVSTLDYFIDCGYISLEIDKKRVLKGAIIHNQTAIDLLYSELKNLQIQLNYGNQNE